MGKKEQEQSKKAEKKIQEKIIEDKTFGLKNKNKSKAVQKFCKGVATQVKTMGKGGVEKILNEQFDEKKKKKKEEEEQALMASLFKTVTTLQQKGNDEEEEEEKDPKKILCAYFKQGLCQKGKKCKYSHDLTLEAKSDKIDLYTDQRNQVFETAQVNEEETINDWNDETLQKVIQVQEKKYNNQKPTEIVCKFFLMAVEQGKYGWKWICPNGMQCIYRHCLPPGYVIKRDAPIAKQENTVLLENKIDEDRNKLEKENKQSTPITYELFLQWKEKRKLRKEKEKQEKIKEEMKKMPKGKQHHMMTGRALFKFDPTLFVDDDEAAGDQVYEHVEEEETFNENEDNPVHMDQVAEQMGQEEQDEDNEGEEGEQDEQQEEEKVEEEDQMQENEEQKQEEQPPEQQDNNSEGQQDKEEPQLQQETNQKDLNKQQDQLQNEQPDEKVELESQNKKKKKKKKNKQQQLQQAENEGQKDQENQVDNVKINEDVFLNEDI